MRMNRLGVLICCCFCAAATAFAEAPELRYVMPNSWRKATRLPPEEEKTFLQNNRELLERIAAETHRTIPVFEYVFSIKDVIYTTSRVYREQAGEDIFYRLLTVNPAASDFTKQESIEFLQSLVYEKTDQMLLLGVGVYNEIKTLQRSNTRTNTSIDIIKNRTKAKGILITHLLYGYDREGSGYTRCTKGQLVGDFVKSEYILLQDMVPVLERNPDTAGGFTDGVFYYNDIERISITASPCLIDPSIPLRYSLQNVFDGDPATSYVENTEDDLMKIYFSINFQDISTVAIINGYAQNIQLYQSNNRIKEIEDDKGYGKKYYLSDNTLIPQILNPYGNSYIYIMDIYKGARYNDTCIAELNIKTNRGWLFGDINE
jgi:hypothetical protein